MSSCASNKKLKELERAALDAKADKAKVFSARLVAMDIRVRMKCQIPLCPHFGQTLTCPPNVPTFEEFTKVVESYDHALLVQMKSPISGDMDKLDKEEVLKYMAKPGKSPSKKDRLDEEHQDLNSMKLAAIKLHKLINDVEGIAMGMGFHYALGLIGGECMLCSECVGVGSSGKCRRPFQARPSMEGVGIDVGRTCIDAGLPFDIPPKKDITWSGLILID